MIQAHPEWYFQTDIIARAFTCWTVAGTVLQQSLARLFKVAGMILQQSLARSFNSHWYNYATMAGTILQKSLTGLFNSHSQDCSTVTGTIIQQSLAWLFNSCWYDYWIVAGTTIQQSLVRLLNSHWHDCLSVTGTILQQWLARFFISDGQYFFFFLCCQNSSTVMFTVEESCHVPGMRHMIPFKLFAHTPYFEGLLSYQELFRNFSEKLLEFLRNWELCKDNYKNTWRFDRNF